MMEKFVEKILILLAVITLTGCVSQPIKTDLSISHPANPQAQVAPFTPPPNIFQGDMQIIETQPTPDTSMTHQKHGKPDSKQMNQQMDHSDMKQMGGDAPTHSDEKESGHQHEEQKQ